MSMQYNAFVTLLGTNLTVHVFRPVFVTLADSNSGVDSSKAVTFKATLEVASVATLAAGLGVSLFMEVRIIRTVRLDGDKLEHEDYKVRTEMRRLDAMNTAVEHQGVVIKRLIEEYERLKQEEKDVDNMHHHRGDTSDANTPDKEYVNPLA